MNSFSCVLKLLFIVAVSADFASQLSAFMDDAKQSSDGGNVEMLMLGQRHLGNVLSGWLPPNVEQLQNHVQDTSSDVYLAYEDNDVKSLMPLVRSHLRGYLEETQLSIPPTLLELTLGPPDQAFEFETIN